MEANNETSMSEATQQLNITLARAGCWFHTKRISKLSYFHYSIGRRFKTATTLMFTRIRIYWLGVNLCMDTFFYMFKVSF